MRYLFELTLKAAVAGCDTELTRTVLHYAKKHNYLISIDEKTAMHALFSTYHGRPMAGDYSLLRVLTDCELTYKIAVTEVNREQIEEIRRRESGGEIKVNAFVIQSLNGSRATSKTASRANSRAGSRREERRSKQKLVLELESEAKVVAKSKYQHDDGDSQRKLKDQTERGIPGESMFLSSESLEEDPSKDMVFGQQIQHG